MGEVLGIISSVIGIGQSLFGGNDGGAPEPPPRPAPPARQQQQEQAQFKLGTDSDSTDRVKASRKKAGSSASIIDSIGGLGQGGLQI